MPNNRRLIIWSVIGIGISSITVQLVTVREFLTQFNGNEITISLVMFCWLMFSGLGSFMAKFFKPTSLTVYSLVILFIVLWPLPQIIIIRYFREAVFIHGASPGFYHIFFYIAATTAIYCFLVGFILPNALDVLKANNYRFTSGDLYITDNIGDISGGVIFSFILVYLLKPFEIIAVTSSFTILIAFFLLVSSRRYCLLILSMILTSLFYGYALNSTFERSTLSGQYGDIVKYLESPFGRLVISEEGPQHTFWESGIPLYSDADIMKSEEKVHYPMSQLKSVGNVLLISGGLGETIDEILKYHPEHIDYVELDPYLTGAAQELGFLESRPSLRIINSDARSFIKETERRYDAIIMSLPDPDTFQLNRFFTDEFFALAKEVLNSEGILSFGMGYYQNYVGGVTKQKLSTIFNTVSSHFESIMVLPGEEAYFLCSDGDISTDIPVRLKKKSISTKYIEGFYHGNITRERIEYLRANIDREESINTDFKPRMINIIFKEWFLKHGNSPNTFLAVLVVLILIYLISIKKEEYVLFSTGAATMGVEMLVIFTFQVIHGYIYLKIGAVVTVFLLGLLPGSVAGNISKGKDNRMFILADIVLICLLLLFFMWNRFFPVELGQGYFLAYSFAFSFFCGFQFPIATRIIGEQMSPAAGCLGADLTGAAFGTIVVGTLLIPLLGVISAIIFLILMKMTSTMIIILSCAKRSR
jgi:spermidine synthase